MRNNDKVTKKSWKWWKCTDVATWKWHHTWNDI